MSETISYTFEAFPGTTGHLTRSTDGAIIPCVLDNMDYQRFLVWVGAGNTPPEGWTGPTNSSVQPSS